MRWDTSPGWHLDCSLRKPPEQGTQLSCARTPDHRHWGISGYCSKPLNFGIIVMQQYITNTLPFLWLPTCHFFTRIPSHRLSMCPHCPHTPGFSPECASLGLNEGGMSAPHWPAGFFPGCLCLCLLSLFGDTDAFCHPYQSPLEPVSDCV